MLNWEDPLGMYTSIAVCEDNSQPRPATYPDVMQRGPVQSNAGEAEPTAVVRAEDKRVINGQADIN